MAMILFIKRRSVETIPNAKGKCNLRFKNSFKSDLEERGARLRKQLDKKTQINVERDRNWVVFLYIV